MRKDYGNFINIDIYGESHSDEIGVVIQGLPEGETFSADTLAEFMARRAPGGLATELGNLASTPRREPDKVVFLAGVIPYNQPDSTSPATGMLTITGEPIKACIYNVDRRSSDYSALRKVLRPGHADLGAFKKWGQTGLRPGSGRFSGRMTAPMCIAGGIIKQLLQSKGIAIHAHISEIAGFKDQSDIEEALLKAVQEHDSIGGIVSCTISGFPAGIGGPLFEGLEGAIASSVFAIPAVKGIEFGNGFEAARLRGSENNDEIFLENGELVTKTNNAGGINGGISTGMDITFNVALKPTPTIGVEQKTVDIVEMTETTVQAGGRHDSCIVPRAVPVVEAAAAIALYDALVSEVATN